MCRRHRIENDQWYVRRLLIAESLAAEPLFAHEQPVVGTENNYRFFIEPFRSELFSNIADHPVDTRHRLHLARHSLDQFVGHVDVVISNLTFFDFQ